MKSVTQEAHEIINGPRRSAYGSAAESFRDVAIGWSVLIGTEVTSKQVAQCMIWLKQVREKNKHGRDNLVDICGYADLCDQIQDVKPNKRKKR